MRVTPRQLSEGVKRASEDCAVEQIGPDHVVEVSAWALRLVRMTRADLEHLLGGGALAHNDCEYQHIVVLDSENKEKGTR